MARIQPLDPSDATGQADELFTAIQSKVGMVPNLYRTLGNAPSVLSGLLALKGELDKGSLSAADKERIALAVGQANGCDYCVAAHTVIGKGAGLSEDETLSARQGEASDPRAQAVLTLAKAVVEREGFVTDAQLADARSAGLDDAVVLEVVGQVILNFFTNFTNHVAETTIDFPAAPQLQAV
ncbi:MAG: carboxymuconolactone decarboxylase family protein [Phycisphaerales bacterium JB063]